MRRVILKFPNYPTMLLKAAVLCVAGSCGLNVAQAQQLNIGYINEQRLVTESLPWKAASAKLNQEFGKRISDLKDMEARLKAMQAKLEKDAPIMSDADRNKGQHD